MTALRQDEFLVMASDGLFDVMGDQSVVDTVSKYLREHDNWCARPCSPHTSNPIPSTLFYHARSASTSASTTTGAPAQPSYLKPYTLTPCPPPPSSFTIECALACARVRCPVWWARSASTSASTTILRPPARPQLPKPFPLDPCPPPSFTTHGQQVPPRARQLMPARARMRAPSAPSSCAGAVALVCSRLLFGLVGPVSQRLGEHDSRCARAQPQRLKPCSL